MSSSLYLVFEHTERKVVLPQFAQGFVVSGYSFSGTPLKESIEAPGELHMPVRCGYYAQDYFRIFISDLAVEFYRETDLPSDLVIGEKQLRSAIFGLPHMRLRRWITTTEGWDDQDERFVHILSEGSHQETLNAGQPAGSR